MTINWANPTSLAVTGGVGPGQDVQGGESLQLSATATYDNGATVDVSKLASWSSDNSNVAQSDGNGVIQIPYFENGGFASVTATLGGQSGAEQLTVDSSYWTGLLPGILAMSLGLGLLFIPFTLTATHGVGKDEAGRTLGEAFAICDV